MTAEAVLNQIMHLPGNEKHKLLARLSQEKELMQEMEELQDTALFDERKQEPDGITLEEATTVGAEN